MQIRKAEERGHANHGWLDSYHTFSFASYYDQQHMGFRKLRVINEDRVKPGMGFGTHGHRDMEIISYVVSGGLVHKDSMGNTSVIRPGEVQRMTAGTGVTHSEFNESGQKSVHFLQIWIQPEELDLTPSYEQVDFSKQFAHEDLVLVASPSGEAGSIKVHQDVRIYAGKPVAGKSLSMHGRDGRYTWLQLVNGKVELNGQTLTAGDGAALDSGEGLEMAISEDAEFLIFDLA